MSPKLIFTAEELKAFPAYTPFVGFTREYTLNDIKTWGRILFWFTPNGFWRVAGEQNAHSIDWILGVCESGIIPLDAPNSPSESLESI